MKKTIWRIFSLFLFALLLFQTLPLTSLAKEDTLPSVPTTYYGREVLSTMENSTALLYAYDQIAIGIPACAERIEIYDGTHPITSDELKMVYDAYRRDHTETFWMGTQYTIMSTSKTMTALQPTYTVNQAALPTYQAAFEEAVAAILEGLDSSMSEFEKELYLHDTLAQKVYYTRSEHAHDAYGALVEGRAVCEGYAEALQYLLQRAGIQSFMILGSSVNPSTNIPESHAWNLVRIDGSYYHTDLTWNDQEEVIFHAYFNMSDEQIAKDHTITPTNYPLPACTKTDAHYFNVMPGTVSQSPYSVDEITALLQASPLEAHVYLPQNDPDFAQWFYDNIDAIAQKMHIIGGFSYGSRNLSNEYILYINTCKHRSLTHVSASTASCTQDGNREYYLCTCGARFVDAFATQRLSASPTIPATGHTWSKAVTDDAHLREKSTDCLTYTSYWYTCSVCDAISVLYFFETVEKGPHTYGDFRYEGTQHWKECACGEITEKGTHTDTDQNQRCDVCLSALSEQGNVSVKDTSGTEDFIKMLLDFLRTDTGKIALIGGGGILLLLLLILLVANKKR